jgi:acetylornithine deacetylase/succinyl-diaminopimelate desuccinylase-like protein
MFTEILDKIVPKEHSGEVNFRYTSGTARQDIIEQVNAEIMAKYKHQHIIWIAQYCYRKCNPESKMDVPSIVYEQIEKDYGKFIEDQTRKTS